jgi:hypothetical protein
MKALQERLRALDKERDALRCELADLQLLVGEDTTFSILGTDKEPAWVAYSQKKVDRRASRRAWEMETLGTHIAPGPWDEDLDLYHGAYEHSWDLSDGYTGCVKRTYMGTWNGYITVPEGHWAAEVNEEEVKEAVSWRIDRCGDGTRMFGFDHMDVTDVKPLSHYCYDKYDDFGGKRQVARAIYLPSFEQVGYLKREDVMKEVEGLKKRFMEAHDPRVPLPPPLGPAPAIWWGEDPPALNPPALGPAPAGPLLDENSEPVYIPRAED